MNNKENELKEILADNFSQDEIERRLKEKINSASKKRDSFTKNSRSKQKVINKKGSFLDKISLNTLLFILLVIMAILIFVAIYLFNGNSKTVNNSNVDLNVDKKESSYFRKLYNSNNYDTYKCYSFDYGKIALPIKKCKQSLDLFLQKNKNANRFEIVPLISQNDTILYKMIEGDLYTKPKELQEKIKEYINIGLSTERILESVWYIKKTLGENTIVTSSQYYIKSDKSNEQGVIIRAYH